MFPSTLPIAFPNSSSSMSGDNNNDNMEVISVRPMQESKKP